MTDIDDLAPNKRQEYHNNDKHQTISTLDADSPLTKEYHNRSGTSIMLRNIVYIYIVLQSMSKQC